MEQLHQFPSKPRSNQQKDLYAFLAITLVTCASLTFYVINESRNDYLSIKSFEIVNMDYQEINHFQGNETTSYSLQGTRNLPKGEYLWFACIMSESHSNSSLVRLNFQNSEEWDEIIINQSFYLKSKILMPEGNYTLKMEVDGKNFEFTTRTYTPDISILKISIEIPIYEQDQNCEIIFTYIEGYDLQYPWVGRNLNSSIRLRGSDGGYALELSQNYNLLGMRNDDDWILIPSGEYLLAAQTKLSYEFYNQFFAEETGYYLPNSQFTEVYVNNQYKGLYLLSERPDRKLFDLQNENIENPEENDGIYKFSNGNGHLSSQYYSQNTSFEQLYPNTFSHRDIIENLINFISNSNETEFQNENSGITQYLTEINLLDLFIFDFFTGHQSIEGESFLLIYENSKQIPLTIIPWNFGHTFGLSQEGKFSTNQWIHYTSYNITGLGLNNLYSKLLTSKNISFVNIFLSKLENRWKKIALEIKSSNLFDEYINFLQRDLIHGISRQQVYISAEETIEVIENWVSERFDLLNNTVFNDLNSSKISIAEKPNRTEPIFQIGTAEGLRYLQQSQFLFSQSEIHEINIKIQENYLEDIVARSNDGNPDNERIYMPVNIQIDGNNLEEVGFRARGNFNIGASKKSFKLKFNAEELYMSGDQFFSKPEYESRRFYGLRHLNLRAAITDITFLNEIAGYDLYRELGYPAPRISWAKVYITEIDEQGNNLTDNLYKGLYLITEDIDKTFLRINFNNPEGNLYKTTAAWASLEMVGPDLRDFYSGSRRVYELETNQELDDYTSFNDAVYAINYNWSDIENHLNLTVLGKFFAANNYMGNWDDYLFIANNYYIYMDPDYGMILLPWDIENSFNLGSNESIQYWGFPDFRYAPLLTDLLSWFESKVLWIGDLNRPLWNNSILDDNFIIPYMASIREITEYSGNFTIKIINFQDFIETAITIPYYETAEIIFLSQIDDYSLILEFTRLNNFITDRRINILVQLGILGY